MSDSDYSSEMQCSYCGKWIFADLARCPKCGNYTDGLGPNLRAEKDGRALPRIYVVMGLLVVLAMLLPIILALLNLLKK